MEIQQISSVRYIKMYIYICIIFVSILLRRIFQGRGGFTRGMLLTGAGDELAIWRDADAGDGLSVPLSKNA